MKKLLSLVLACLMLVGVLAGCGQTATDGTTAAGNDKGETTNIIWMVRSEEPVHYKEVMEAVNAKLLEDLNMTLDLRFIAPGDYDTKMQMAMAGGDEWDLCFTSSWSNNYVGAAGKGALLELPPELLAENAPNVMATIPEKLWDGVKVNGDIYAMINYQVMYDQSGMWFLTSALEEQNIDATKINSWETLNAAIEKLAAAYPDKYATRGAGMASPELWLQEEPICCILNLPVLMFDQETKKIDNNKFFELVEPALQSYKMWKDNNWTPADAATMKDENTLINQGMILSRYQRVKPGVETALKDNHGQDFTVIPMGKPTINTNAVQSTLTGVNINSKHPEKAIQMFDYIFSNKEVANMLFFGLEGQDYNLVDGRIERLEGCWTTPQWELGNQFNAMLAVGDEEGVWEATMKGNEEAGYDALFGFVPDRTPVETELANLEAVWMEYKDILYYGLQDYKTVIPEMMDKMNLAGLEKVTVEMQKQVDAFLAAK